MRSRRSAVVVACFFSVLAPVGAALLAQGQAVPQDLKPLLARPGSEMRLVVTRYDADRRTLNTNYAGPGGFNMPGGRGGRGRGAAAATPAPASPPPTPVQISAARLARLKRFDLDWQTALGRLQTSTLSPAASSDLAGLKKSIADNLAQLEADNLMLAQIVPAVPFAAKLVALVEARIRVAEINSMEAARTLTEVRNQIVATMAAPPVKRNAAIAANAAQATDTLRAAITEWFSFYNGYDPMFTWWMGMPYEQVDKALQDYAGFLRQQVADPATPAAPAAVAAIAPAPAPSFASVPDLQEIVGLTQDEMRDIVARFNAEGNRGGRGGRGGSGGAAPAAETPAATRDNRAWLTALQSLDFDRLSRNAQVDYLYMKWRAETDITHETETIAPGPAFRPDDSKIQGKPRGRDGLISDLRDNMIPYTPEQLITLANQEFLWCENEMRKASRELGYGDDWKKALEHVKQTAVPPGGQPRMIMGLLEEAVAYLRTHDLITVPAVAAESQHMTMLSPQAQLTSPFFLGGDHILVSYPTNTMEFDARMQSMRGNNPGFSHATAFHEMIPGHNLVGYLTSRYRDYRPSLTSGGPFYGEGWPLYWELTMYELGFNTTPEQRIGALFWRMHRCARIIFSLNFHMGDWTPGQAVDFLVEKVGHERDNAMAEVRRSFESPQYQNQPLYQAAYLLGGLQLRGLRRQLVDGGIMSNKQFHDEIMRQGNMPMALIRLAVTREKLTRDMDINWKFYGELK
ncbi:MAG TPA: DUF885 family protein [Vicinamibacterales bacterium]|nr:DUF885 family protein [Vicinamibacterales bacterium]